MKALKSEKAKQMDPDEININLINEFRKDRSEEHTSDSSHSQQSRMPSSA